MPLDDQASLSLSPVVREAIDRFRRCQEWESTARTFFLDDYKFSQADAYNGYQWPNEVRRNRDVDEKPCLTINKVRQHNLQITNDMRQNKPNITFIATGGEATYASAQVFKAWMRHVEYRSRSQWWYDKAEHYQVNAGWGFLRLMTDYVDEDTFDQEILVKGIWDPLTVYVDRDAKEPDKSDANYAFIFDTTDREEFEKLYPKWKDLAAENALGDVDGWMGSDKVRRCEYYRRVRKPDTLYAVMNGQQVSYLRKSVLVKGGKDNKSYTKEMIQALDDDPNTKKRQVEEMVVEYYLILGTKVVEKSIWPGSYIPLAKVCGEETVIEGLYDCRGHTRALIDPQRMYNYWSSTAVEYGALQTKTPWIAPAEAIEGFETYWNNANTQNVSVLPYKALRDDGSEIPMPKRIEPPVPAPVALSGMQISQTEFAMASGQQDANFGQPGNERSGRAIARREAGGDRATFHFLDGMALALQHIGRMAIEIFPKIYDTRRVMMILAEDGTEIELTIDPQMAKHHKMEEAVRGEAVKHALNPALGKYEVQAQPGPGYATQREESFDAFKLILTQNPQLTAVLGDILFRAADFPHAEEASQRLRRMVPAHALGEGPSPMEEMQQKQISQLSQLLSKAMEDLSKERIKLKGKEQQRDIDVYGALTNRLKVLLDAKLKAAQTAVSAVQASGGDGGEEGAVQAAVSADDIRGILADLLPDLIGIDLSPVVAANAESHSQGEAQGEMPLPMPGPMQPALPPGVRTDYSGAPFERDFSNSHAYRRL